MTHRILLFDLDGVLIPLGGYHRALQATVNFYTQQMGLGDLAPDSAAIESLEMAGVTLEWDSSAICLAILITDLWSRDPQLRLPGTWQGILSAIRKRAENSAPHPGYARWAAGLSAARCRGRSAPEAALELLLGASRAAQAGTRGKELRRALEILLGRTRDFRNSVTMRVVQHFTLGSEGFRSAYGEEPSVVTPSLLWGADRPTLSERETRGLVRLTDGGATPAAVFTLRLTRPPLPSAEGGEYAPEAEMSLERIGLAHWPVVGFGQLCWLASKRGVDSDAYLKPSPVHSLVAISRGLGAGDEDALLSALRLFEEHRLTGRLAGLQEGATELHVFEDSPSSLRGAERAAELLRKAGAKVAFHPWGIGSTPGRILLLKDFGYPVFDALGPALTESRVLAGVVA